MAFWTPGFKIIINHLIKYKIKIITIGVKSNGQNDVGIIDFTKVYIGSIISAINFGLIFNHKSDNQDKITSIKII